MWMCVCARVCVCVRRVIQKTLTHSWECLYYGFKLSPPVHYPCQHILVNTFLMFPTIDPKNVNTWVNTFAIGFPVTLKRSERSSTDNSSLKTTTTTILVRVSHAFHLVKGFFNKTLTNHNSLAFFFFFFFFFWKQCRQSDGEFCNDTFAS